jgi:hypothetical protein
MARSHYKALLGKVLLGFISEDDPVLAMLEWVAHQMMLIEAENKVGAEKGKHSKEKIGVSFLVAQAERVSLRPLPLLTILREYKSQLEKMSN